MNEKRDKVLRSYIIEKDAALLFPYLKEGKYSIRITEDLNRNGIVDTGNLLEHRQPEKVRFYKLRDGSFLITIKESLMMYRYNIDDMNKKIEGRLSVYEKKVLAEYLTGDSYDTIAARLGKPEKSIDNAIQRIRKKLDQ